MFLVFLFPVDFWNDADGWHAYVIEVMGVEIKGLIWGERGLR